jgi:hypothetical protein
MYIVDIIYGEATVHGVHKSKAHFYPNDGRSNCNLFKVYVTGSNDAILNKVDQTTAVSLVEVHHGPGCALGHSFATPPCGPAGQCQSRGLD